MNALAEMLAARLRALGEQHRVNSEARNRIEDEAHDLLATLVASIEAAIGNRAARSMLGAVARDLDQRAG